MIVRLPLEQRQLNFTPKAICNLLGRTVNTSIHTSYGVKSLVITDEKGPLLFLQPDIGDDHAPLLSKFRLNIARTSKPTVGNFSIQYDYAALDNVLVLSASLNHGMYSVPSNTGNGEHDRLFRLRLETPKDQIEITWLWTETRPFAVTHFELHSD